MPGAKRVAQTGRGRAPAAVREIPAAWRAHLGRVDRKRRHLLDVNVWVALFDDAHVASPRANAFIETPDLKVATCPLVENGVIRVLNLPSYGKRGALGLLRVREQLRLATNELDHAFWPDDVSLLDDGDADFSRVHGHQQVTDLYLLALAVRHEGTLVTFDRAIPLAAVPGASEQHLLVL